MSGQDGDNKTILGKTLTFPPKVALVKPSGSVSVAPDGKTTTVSAGQAQQQGGATTYRTINQSHMRLVMPATGAVPTPQIIQTHLMPQAMLKQVDSSGRTQITAVPARSLAQTSFTVTRSPTPTSFVPRATNVTGARATVVSNPRTPTPPTANIANFVRSTGSNSRTPSPATVISAVPGTWMSTVPAGVQVGVQGSHLIRASINPSTRPQGRVITQQQTGPGGVMVATSVSASSTANTTTLQVTGGNPNNSATGIQNPQVSQMQQTSGGGQLLTTMPRPQTATLVYSNVQNHQQGQTFGAPGAGGAQRLTLSHSRPIRPIQLTATNNRITGTGLRTANISIRSPNVPVLASGNVLTTNVLPAGGVNQGGNLNQQGNVNSGGMGQQQQRTVTTGPGGIVGTVTGGGLGGTGTGTANLATRIIQVQAPQSGGTTQVINTGRIASGSLMTLTPVLSQVGGAGGVGGAVGRGGGAQLTAGKVQPSLTITHVGKITSQGATTVAVQQQQQQSGGNMQQQQQGQGGHITMVSQAPQQQTMIVTMGGNQQTMGGPGGTLTTTAGTIMASHGGGMVGQAHQVMANVSGTTVSSSVSGTTTMLPLSGITTTVGRAGGTGIVRTITTTTPQQQQGMGNVVPSTTTTLLPLKVMPQQQQQQGGSVTGQTVVETQLQQAQQAGSIFIHSRSPNPIQVGGPGAPSGAGILTLTAAAANTSLNNIISAVPYSVQSSVAGGGGGPGMGQGGGGSSFAVVTNRGAPIQGVIPVATTIMATGTATSVQSMSGMTGQGQQPTTHQIITMTQPPQGGVGGSSATQHIMIPVAAAGKMAGSIGQSPRPSILRKRDNEGIIFSSSSSVAGVTSTVQSTAASGLMLPTTMTVSTGINQAVTLQSQQAKGVKNLVPILHAMGSGNAPPTGLNVISAPSAKMEIISKERTGLYVSPPAGSPSDGSTTVSATSSPGLDKQEEEELKAMTLSMKLQSELKKCNKAAKEKEAAAAAGRSRESSPRKRTKRQNDSNVDFRDGGGAAAASGAASGKAAGQPGNKENSHPIATNPGATATALDDVAIKKPRSCSLLETYKHNWKAAHNHFLRYSDVKPREERRPTVIDLANQEHVTQKVNGWKIIHLSGQMENLCEMESQVFNKLSEMLQCMEAHDQATDVVRVNELLKGNMQRSKIINEGITEARNQMMKVFDHKSHVSDIIHRCASKRNFKKREKM